MGSSGRTLISNLSGYGKHEKETTLIRSRRRQTRIAVGQIGDSGAGGRESSDPRTMVATARQAGGPSEGDELNRTDPRRAASAARRGASRCGSR
jgi:hypothetical protein